MKQEPSKFCGLGRERMQKGCKLLLLLGLLPGLTGCLSHTRSVLKARQPDVVLNATADQLIQQMNARYDAVHSLTATVDIAVSVGGANKGKVTEYTSVRGYILTRKPEMLHVIGLLPVVRTTAFDMVSDGSTFKLLVPPKNKAIEGNNTINKPSKNALENLRPDVFLDSLLIKSVQPGELVALTSDMRTVKKDEKKQEEIQEPDYTLSVFRRRENSQELVPVRLIHISRVNLMPYEQDIYDNAGKVVTRAVYGTYTSYGDIQFPSTITIIRPQDEYTLTLTVLKLVVNQSLGDDQFALKIPDGTKVQKLQ